MLDRPCRRCGIARRITDGRCRKCAHEYFREYYQSHKDSIAASRKKWRSNPNNRRKELIKQRQYHKEHPEIAKRYRIKWLEKQRNDPAYIFRIYKRNAALRELQFDVTFDQFVTFWNRPCYYCGTFINTIGIDRKNNSLGYILSNLVPCCRLCNRLKMAMDINDFINHCKKIVDHVMVREVVF